MNSTLQLSQQQGERIAAEIEQQKYIDRSAEKDARLAREAVPSSDKAEKAIINLEENESR